MLMAFGRGCFTLAILLATVDIQPGGCIQISSSVSQKGKQLSLNCTVRHNKEEAEGLIVFLCKDRTSNCSPETSLKQLRLKRDPEIDGVNEISSQLVFTINHATSLDNGIYQCCARSQTPYIHLQGRFISVTEAGNDTVTGLEQRPYSEFSHSEGILISGFLQEKVWMLLVTSLMALRGLF
ncbi:CD160 antigen [Dasypus novemcinctus]|uniref:CD160 antigen n=1 Tax=Dasypus novemcinctus TaxID=9361 RepID=UPI0003CC1601|nr:CD160 antigen [Dasypus novemcinctus]